MGNVHPTPETPENQVRVLFCRTEIALKGRNYRIESDVVASTSSRIGNWW